MYKLFANKSLGIYLLALCAALAFAQAPASPLRTGKLVQIEIHSPALEGNKLGDPADQKAIIYLPPSYATVTERRFPTLYLLHGFTGSPDDWTNGGYQGMNLSTSMDKMIASGAASEMIVVLPNGNNRYLNSAYTNSSVTGNWEDYIVRDVVNYVDSNYRTLANSASRGIAGHSMGGYGALMLAMRHPEIFGALYAMSPCCVAMINDLTSENQAWHAAIAAQTTGKLPLPPDGLSEGFAVGFVALGAAWSPNVQRDPTFVDLPYRVEGKTLVDNESVIERWKQHMPLYVAAHFKENLLQLRGIYIDYGYQDELLHIPIAIRLFSEELDRLQVAHTIASYQGDHEEHVRERFETFVIPFFSRVLER